MLDQVEALMRGHHILPDEHRLLLAVSGGLDSVVMWHALRHLGFECEVAHVNYGLRGNDSLQDQQFVESLGHRWNTRVHVKAVEVPSEASVQQWARDARYAWFEALCEDRGLDWISTGHHANDHLETLLFRAHRGTGIAGMAGIREVRGRIVRPLRCVSRKEVEHYAVSEDLAWREDASNASDAYARNRIRHHWVPLLESMQPDIVQEWTSRSQEFEQAQARIEQQADRQEAQRLQLPLDALSDDPVLWELFRRRAFSSKQFAEVLGLANAASGKFVESVSHRAEVYQGCLWVIPRPNVPEIQVFESLQALQASMDTRVVPIADLSSADLRDPTHFVADLERVVFPLTLRTWRTSDRIAPFGMEGSQLLSDVFQQAGIPRFDRPTVPILENEEGVLWVEGLRRSRHALISEETSNALIVSRRPIV